MSWGGISERGIRVGEWISSPEGNVTLVKVRLGEDSTILYAYPRIRLVIRKHISFSHNISQLLQLSKAEPKTHHEARTRIPREVEEHTSPRSCFIIPNLRASSTRSPAIPNPNRSTSGNLPNIVAMNFENPFIRPSSSTSRRSRVINDANITRHISRI